MRADKVVEGTFHCPSRFASSFTLTTLKGGEARPKWYTEVPEVQSAIAMSLCPQNAATWWNHPRLLSRACKFTLSLTAKAYNATRKAASALHAINHPAGPSGQATKRSARGYSKSGLMQKLRSATDSTSDEGHSAASWPSLAQPC